MVGTMNTGRFLFDGYLIGDRLVNTSGNIIHSNINDLPDMILFDGCLIGTRFTLTL
jgi:hypothetical protein